MNFVINRRNLPSRLPVTSTIAWYLFLEHFNTPGWIYGVVFTILGIIWVVSAFFIYLEEPVDIFVKKDN